MWRFFLAGLITVCSLVLLFMASMGDPLSELHHAQTLLQVTSPPVDPGAQQARPDDAAVRQAAQQQENALRQEVQSLQAKRADDAAQQQQAANQKEDELRQQIQSLQAKLAQTSQDVTALRTEADTEKHAMEALRQQHDADQADLTHLRAAASSPPPPPQQPVAPTADAQTGPGKSADNLPTPPKVPQSKPPVQPVRSAQNQSKQPALDFSAAQTVLNRLRREPDAAPPAQNFPPAPPPKSPQARLTDAHSALTVGRIDDARRLLEQAQVQLAFRPIAPDGDMASSGSVAAGDVAEALSMLNAGDVRDALRYTELAMQRSGSAEMQTITDAQQSPYREGWPHP